MCLESVVVDIVMVFDNMMFFGFSLFLNCFFLYWLKCCIFEGDIVNRV